VDLTEAKGKFVPALEGKRIQRYVCEKPDIAVRLDSRKPLYITKEDRFRSAVFLIRQTAAFPIVAPHEHTTHFRNSLLALFAPRDGVDVKYLVALLNSRLLRFVYMESTREAQQRTFPQVKLGALRGLPIRKINLADAQDKRRHDELVGLVEEALSTQKRAANEKNPIRKEALQRGFEVIDAELDRRVFALYGLSTEEMELVESRLARLIPGDAGTPPSWRPETSKPVGGVKRAHLPQTGSKDRAASGGER
jgi:hypothetical protein